MKLFKKVIPLLLVSAMSLPCIACSHDGSSKNESSSTDNANIQTSPDGMIGYELTLGDIPNEDSSSSQPAVTTIVGEDGSLYVPQTDINGTTVTVEGGSVATVPYTGTTLATSYVEPSYKPDIKCYQALWLDMSKKADYVFDGEFLVFDIKIKDDAKDGVYPIDFYHLDMANYDAKNLDVTANVGYLVVGNATAPNVQNEESSGLTLTPGIVSGKAGDTVHMVLQVKNNPGFVGFDLQFHYDANAMTITDGGAGKDFSSRSSLTAHEFN